MSVSRLSVSSVSQAFKEFKFFNTQLSVTQKVLIISLSTGVALMAVAQYLKRKRKAPASKLNSRTRKLLPASSEIPASPGANQPGSLRSMSPGNRSVHRQGSVFSALSDRLSAAGLGPQDTSTMTPQQLGTMGMEALDTGINCWEDALEAYQRNPGAAYALTGEEEAEFAKEIQQLLEIAYKLQRKCEMLFLDQRSVLFRAESSVKGDSFRFNNYSSAESFVSAQDEVIITPSPFHKSLSSFVSQIADLRDFEEYADISADVDQFPLYLSAVKHMEEFGIPYRCLRTEMVRCSSDMEYLCKLHCVRLAFQWMFQDNATWHWFADSGRQVLTDLLLYADKDPKDFLVAYEEMLQFIREDNVWIEVEKELALKNVKAMTFYDVVLDYILMDAFEDLETPPSSVTAVVQNRWLSHGFKESALTTAVWSVLKAKRRLLNYPNGFMAHFYSISEQMSPIMAWGFLGPDEKLKEICQYFKDQIMGFLMDIFSFQNSRFTTVEELAGDVLKHTKTRVDNLCTRLSQNYDQI